MIVRFSVESLRWFCLRYWMSPPHTVGTPAENVTRSDSKSSYTDLPSSAAPGKTIFEPTRGAAKGRPQAFTWNIGTIGSTVSRVDRHIASGRQMPYACSTVERWL